MTLEIFANQESLAAAAARTIADRVKNQPDAVLCLAAGDTPRLAYATLASIVQKERIDFSLCTFIALDEWVGIPPENTGSCADFLRHHLASPLKLADRQMLLFNALSSDPLQECKKMNDAVSRKGGIDLMLVGVGMNGHIGFNEPGVSPELYAHIVTLDDTTRRVGQKYFSSATSLEYGITLGLKQFLESRQAIVMASGHAKADIIRRALEEPVSPQVPASIVRDHPNAKVMLDAGAASLLRKKH